MVTRGATLSKLPNIIEANTKKAVKNKHFLLFPLRKDENTLGSMSSSAMAWIILVEDPIDCIAAPILERMIPIKTTQRLGQATSAARI